MLKRCFQVIVAIIIVFLTLKVILMYFMPFAIGALLSLFVYPVVKVLFTYLKIPYKLSVALGLMMLFITGPLLITGCFALLKNEIFLMANHLPQYTSVLISSIRNIVQSFPTFLHDLTHPYLTHKHLTLLIKELEQLILNAGKQLLSETSKFAGNLPSYLFSFGIVMIAAYYILSDFESWKSKLPKKLIEQIELIRELGLREAGSYFLSQLLLSLFTFIITLTGLLIIGNPHPFLLALLSAGLDFVPLAGSLLLFLPLTVFYFIQSGPAAAAGTLVIYIVIIAVRQIAEPKIVGDRMGLHPLAALIILYTSVTLLGLKGLILTPVFMIMMAVLIKIRLFTAVWRYITTGEHPFIKR
ncbi:AI-2E family transporter [Jeotgalibacillus haloalkalitolerans]|uniref:AI-2E family transporter n=1 Tax=Jeotgalibacillus haloalkalitolerans TaxID=3104292 RepID=A0ABU5KMR1_9BACL|nr:AI-2E family transporter [Jeotgalibacillus sp. HH7-29]MDZ5712450.1 AI-2E family transporter [Jeotgalibacillus sp. HH7-29]